jgi:hypothetical protein
VVSDRPEVLRADVRSCHLEQIGIGVGILGRVYRVHMRGTGVPDSVVVKLPTADERGVALCEDLDFYLCEVSFYEQVGLANPLRPARPYFTAFDPSTHEFILVLEDLGRLRVVDQIVGCSVGDAEVVVDAIAGHHAYWWDSERFASMSWLKSYNTPPYPAVVAANFEASWPVVLDRFGENLSPAIRAFGKQFPTLTGWFGCEFTRPPCTFLYFLSQSLTTESRRACEDELITRYAERLRECAIDYNATQLDHDYRLTTAWCFVYPVIGLGRFDVVNDRQDELLRVMLNGAADAIEDHDALALIPDT